MLTIADAMRAAGKGVTQLISDCYQTPDDDFANREMDLIDAFARNLDVHTVTAARVFDVDESKVDSFQRRFAKVVNYGLAYGMEAYGLGPPLDIPPHPAKEILDPYFELFPNGHP